MEKDGDQLLDVREAAALLHLGRQTLYNWVSEGRITSTKLGGRRLFRRADLLALIASSTIKARDLGRN